MTDYLICVCICAKGAVRVLNLFDFVQNAIGVENFMKILYWNTESLISFVMRKGKEYIFCRSWISKPHSISLFDSQPLEEGDSNNQLVICKLFCT